MLTATEYIDVVESYKIICYTEMLAHLKSNVGNNSVHEYYDDDRIGDILYQQTYRFFASSCCLVSVDLTPLKQNVFIDYFGGTQCVPIGTQSYIPYSEYDSIAVRTGTALNLTKDTWKDEDFPPYKFLSFSVDSPSDAFAVGYCIDYGQGKPAKRIENTTNGSTSCAVFQKSAANKMYPYFYNKGSAVNIDAYGKCLSAYAWRMPLIKDDDTLMSWYRINNDIYVEIDFLVAYEGIFEFPAVCEGKRCEILAKTSGITALAENISGGIYLKATGVGSISIKCF